MPKFLTISLNVKGISQIWKNKFEKSILRLLKVKFMKIKKSLKSIKRDLNSN